MFVPRALLRLLQPKVKTATCCCESCGSAYTLTSIERRFYAERKDLFTGLCRTCRLEQKQLERRVVNG